MLDTFLPEILFLLILVCLLYIFLNWFCKCNSNETQLCNYTYGDAEGPHTWRWKFVIRGDNQSPINILSVCALVVAAESVPPIDFTVEHHVVPQDMKLVNDGYTVAIYSTWLNGRKPVICGGPLCDEYKLFSIRFRWGHNDEEGSEHMIDMRRYAMEMQVTYNKCSCKCIDMSKSVRSCAVVIISYVFEITPVDNPYLETIVNSLKYVKTPCKTCQVRPVPLSLLAPQFVRRYFTYVGSLTHPPCSEGVRWIIQPEPLTVSTFQVQRFRSLIGFNGRILSNTRPVQNTNNRDIIFYE